jgi:protein-L-isoaspartate O-methyltransferase
LDEVTRSGQVAGHHDAPPGDPYWRRYISGQLDLARLIAAEVVRKLQLPGDPRSLLDIGGGHGWYSAQLAFTPVRRCSILRHPDLGETKGDQASLR